jgi:threonine synthase
MTIDTPQSNDNGREELRRTAADPSLPMLVRLEAFEDLAESEVGDSMLIRARNLERASGLRQIWLKFEGDNPSGTHKDRIAFAQVHDALRRGFEGLAVASCGNYGAAVAAACELAGLRCQITIPERYHSPRIDEMRRLGGVIIRAPGDYEASVDRSREQAEAEGLYDANPGGDNEPIQLRAYGEIAAEIYDQLRDAPAAVACPVSNGTTLAGLYRGFQSLHRRGKTSRMPRLVAGSTHHKNPIVRAWRKGLDRCEDLDPAAIRETPVNEPLVNWHAIDGELALAALRQTNGWAGDASDRRMLELARALRAGQGLDVLPASTAGLAALLAHHREAPLPPDRYVVLLTGRATHAR